MIWYFIAGYIAGMVGTLLLGRHFYKKTHPDITDK